MNFKHILTALVLGSVAMSANADSVNFIINGKILPRTCSTTAPNGNTITMNNKYVDDFTSVNQKVDGGVDGSFKIQCPKTQVIKLTLKDTGAGALSSPSNYLVNVANTNKAGNVGVAIDIKNSAGTAIFTTLQTNTPQTLKAAETAASAADYSTLQDLNYTVRPHYYSTAANVTPGDVQSTMTLEIEYP